MAKRRRGVNSRKRYLQKKKHFAASIRKKIPIVCGGLLVVGSIVAIGYTAVLNGERIVTLLDSSRFLTVKKIAVKGNKRICSEEILKRCGIMKESKMYHIKTSSITASLRADPWIEKVRCVKKWWGSVVIDVKERTPIALINTGSIQLVDRKGIVLPIEKGKTYRLPLLSGVSLSKDENGRWMVDTAVIKKISQFITTAQTEDTTWFQKITQIDVSDKETIRCCIVSPHITVDADYNTNKKQLKNLRYLLEVLAQDVKKPVRIDLRYQNLAFVCQESNERTQ